MCYSITNAGHCLRGSVLFWGGILGRGKDGGGLGTAGDDSKLFFGGAEPLLHCHDPTALIRDPLSDAVVDIIHRILEELE